MAVTSLDDSEVKNKHISADAAIDRTKLAQRVLGCDTIPFDRWRVSTALQTVLTGTPSGSDLGVTTGTYGSGVSYISAGDLKAAGATTRRARAIVAIPNDYEAGETVTIRAHAGMTTTVADVSCTIDFEAWRIDKEDGTLGAADLVTTSATSINSTTEDDFSFQVTASTLIPGDQLDIRMTIACNDAATVTAVIPSIYAVELLSDRR